MDLKNVLRDLPKIDDIMRDARMAAFKGRLPDRTCLEAAREAVSVLRDNIMQGRAGAADDIDKKDELRESAVNKAAAALDALYAGRMRRVINATGVLIHTNLGRAPLASAGGLSGMLSGYVNLEYDCLTGERRSRGFFAHELIRGLTGAEAALCVNNNAAALLLVLNTLCRGKEVLLSRGEAVEIGGSFRLSGIIEAGGAVLREVGATNRTYIHDYEDAVGAQTGAILKVHRSNFMMTGYTSEVGAGELALLARARGIPLIEDMGSGVLTDLSRFGLPQERQAAAAIADGVNVITFSGDKLLGGPQAGIIAGEKAVIERVSKNPLMRCVRPDKTALWMLESCLGAYLTDGRDIPLLQMAAADTLAKARALLTVLEGVNLSFEIIETTAEVGGGTLPGVLIKSHGICCRCDKIRASELERRLRLAEVPVVCRMIDGRVVFDVIAIDEGDFEYIAGVLGAIADPARGGKA